MRRLQATAIAASNSLDYVSQVFALGEARRTVVGVRDAQHAGQLQGIEVDQCTETSQRHGWYSTAHALIDEDLPAQVTYTSGTEGQPKGIVLSHANLADTARRLIRAMGLTNEIREYVGVPATYSFGMGRFRAIAAVGGQAYLSPRGFDPLELARMLEAGEVNALSAVPTLLRILLDAPDAIDKAGRKLRWMEIGSQYMSADEKQCVRELFPNAQIVQHYGLTEASRSTFLEVSTATEDMLESVGEPQGDVEIDFDEQGRIRIRGPHVARWRVDAEGLHDLCEPEDWLQTNDLGHLRDGYLHFDGRADDLINCGGVKIVPDVLEERIRARLGSGARIAVARVPDAARGEAVLAVLEGRETDLVELKAAVVAGMRELGADAAGSLHVRHVAAIPVTATGKPRRRQLTADFEEQPTRARRSGSHALVKWGRKLDFPFGFGSPGSVETVFKKHFSTQDVSRDSTFTDLGGDSLTYIAAAMDLERVLGELPVNWHHMPLHSLQALGRGRRLIQWIDTPTLSRAVAIVLIVIHHLSNLAEWGQSRAHALLFIAGWTYSALAVPSMLVQRSPAPGLLLLGRVTFLTIGVMTVTWAVTGYGSFPALLLVSNWMSPATPGAFWFIEVYAQLLLVCAVVFAFARSQRAVRTNAFAIYVAASVAGIVLYLLLHRFSDADLFRRLPHLLAWIFFLGMAAQSVEKVWQRIVVSAILLLCFVIFFGVVLNLFLIATLAMVWIPRIPLPGVLVKPVRLVAGASLMIYLTHFLFASLSARLFGDSAFASVAVALVGGVAAWNLYVPVDRLILSKLKHAS